MFVGMKGLIGSKAVATFVIASYLVEDGGNYVAGYEPDLPSGSIPVTKVYGYYSKTEGTDPVNNGLFMNGSMSFIGSSDTPTNNTKLNLVIPATVSEISGTNTLYGFTNSVLTFEDRLNGETLRIGSGVFSGGYTNYTNGMKFPDNTEFMTDCFKAPGMYKPYLSCSIYIGANSRFVSPSGQPEAINFMTKGNIYSETDIDALLNGNTVDAGNSIIAEYNGITREASYPVIMSFYQSVDSEITDNPPGCLKGYYVKELNYYIVDYVSRISDDAKAYVIYDDKVKTNIAGASILSNGNTRTLTITKEGGFEGGLQIQYGNRTIRESNGTFDISDISQTTAIHVKPIDWIVTFMQDESEVFGSATVEDGGSVKMDAVPFMEGKEFTNWRLGESDYDMAAAVTSDLVLTPRWTDGTVYLLTISSMSSLITVSEASETPGNDLNQYGMIKPDGDIKLEITGKEKIDLGAWRVTIGDSQTISLSSPGTHGNITVSDDCRTITISDINANVIVDLDAIYISESNAPTPVVSTETPNNIIDVVSKWSIGTGQISNEQNVWAGGSSEPLILGDYAYVRMGTILLKIDTNDGTVLSTAESELTYAFFHNLGYLGNGYIVDYVTEDVFDMDLQPAGFKVPGMVVFDDKSKTAYSFTSASGDVPAKISRYDAYNPVIENGYLRAEWSKEITHSLYINQGAPSQPLIFDGSIYWLSGERDDQGKTVIYISNTKIDGTADITSNEITKMKGLLLDNGWLTTDGTYIYVTSYGMGLLSSASLGTGQLVKINPANSTQYATALPGGSAVTSAIVFSDDLAFVKVGGDIYVYGINNVQMYGAPGRFLGDPLATIHTALSHGSITVNKCGSDTDYYIYYAAYESGKIHIVKYDSVQNKFTDSIVDDLHTYCSQGIRVTQSGNMVYYDDSGRLYGYVPLANNAYTFVIDDGTSKILVEGTGADSASALASTRYGSTSNGILLGARASLDSDYSDGYSLYVLEYGTWKAVPNGDMFSQDYGNIWLLTKSAMVLPDNTTQLTIAGTNELTTLNYVKGNTITVDFGTVGVTSPYASYPGMVVKVLTDTRTAQTVNATPADLTVRMQGNAYQQDLSYSFVMPSQDVTLTNTPAIAKYTVTFVDEDGTTVLMAAAEYDEGTAAASISKPSNPTKQATAQYTYEFAGWSPAIADVTGNATYTATYTSVLNKYTVTFVDDDGTTVLKAATEYAYGTAAADIAKPNDPTKTATAQYTYEFAGWSPAIADVTGNATYTATYTAVPVSADKAQYGMTAQATDSGSMRTYTISIARSSGNADIDNARLLVIADYGGMYVNVYSKIDLDASGNATETVKLSTTGLTGLMFDIVEGFPAGAYDSYGTLTPALS